MNRGPFLACGTAIPLCLLTLAISVVAQQKLTVGDSSKLDQAVVLFENGKPQEARAVIAMIDKTDASYGTAICYDALCLYSLNDKKAFLKAVKSSELQEATISPEMREDLNFKQIEALFFYRRFEEFIPKAQEFQMTYERSAQLNALAEYQMAVAFERGMKTIYEASILNDTNEVSQHVTAGKSNLLDFLSFATSFNKTNYQVLSDRKLREEIWLARMTLGDEQTILKEIPVEAAADREKMGLLGIQLYKKLQPGNVDQNLQRMTKFNNDFPDSKHRKRVEFDMANISFSRAEAISKEAEAAEQSGDVKMAASKRVLASDYFKYTRVLQKELSVDSSAGIEASDVLDREDDLLHSYYLEKDYSQQLSLAITMVQESTPGEIKWMMGKDYSAIALLSQSPPDLRKAASELDDVLALNFNGRPDHDHQVLVAAKWRIYVAHRNEDGAKGAQIVQWVQDSICCKNQKVAFLKIYSALVAPVKIHAK